MHSFYSKCFDLFSLRLFCAVLSLILLALKVSIKLSAFLHCCWLSPSSTSWIIYCTCWECNCPSLAAGHRAESVGHQQLTGNVKAAIITSTYFRNSLWEGSRIYLLVELYNVKFAYVYVYDVHIIQSKLICGTAEDSDTNTNCSINVSRSCQML